MGYKAEYARRSQYHDVIWHNGFMNRMPNLPSFNDVFGWSYEMRHGAKGYPFAIGPFPSRFGLTHLTRARDHAHVIENLQVRTPERMGEHSLCPDRTIGRAIEA